MDWSIQPGKGVGPARLGTTRNDMRASLGDPLEETGSSTGFTQLKYPRVTVCFHDERCEMIIVEHACSATAPNGVSVGMKWEDLIKTCPSIVFDCETDLWMDPDTPGLWYEIAAPPKTGDEPLNPPWISERFEVQDPERAFVRSIYVMETEDSE